MTLGELYDGVAFLGFETRLEDEAVRRGFYAALNRGLYEVNLLRPKRARVRFLHHPPRNLLPAGNGFLRRAGEIVSLALPEGTVSYAVILSGTGRLSVTDTTGETILPFSGRRTVLRGFVSGAATLSFGDAADIPLSYTVSALAAYDRRESTESGDIPVPGEPSAYAMKPLLPLFSSFCPLPLRRIGAVGIPDCTTADDTVFLPPGAPEGEYEALCFVGMPVFSDGDDTARVLPLDEDLCRLLPELLASALWLDDAPDKAKYYYSVYQRNFAMLRAVLRGADGHRVECPNNW